MAAIESDTGFIKLPRAIFSEPWARRPSCLALFVYLLAHANREPKEWNGITIGRGQFVTSRSNLVAGTGISEKCVRSALQGIVQAGRAKSRSYTGSKPLRIAGSKPRSKSFTLITICDYDSYSGYSAEVVQVEGQVQNETRAKSRAKSRATTREDMYLLLFEIEPDPAFRAVLKDWIDYKHERNEPFKAKSSISAVRTKLHRESGENVATARAMIEKAMASGWQGFFPLDETIPRPAGHTSTPSRHDSRFIDTSDVYKANY